MNIWNIQHLYISYISFIYTLFTKRTLDLNYYFERQDGEEFGSKGNARM